MIAPCAMDRSVDQSRTVMIKQNDGQQQVTYLIASGSLNQNAVPNAPDVLTLVPMSVAGSSTNTTNSNVTAGSAGASTNVVCSKTHAVAQTIDIDRVWTHSILCIFITSDIPVSVCSFVQKYLLIF